MIKKEKLLSGGTIGKEIQILFKFQKPAKIVKKPEVWIKLLNLQY